MKGATDMEQNSNLERLDAQLLQLFTERMKQTPERKDPDEDRKVLLHAARTVPAEMRQYAISLYSLLLDLGRSYQERDLSETSDLTGQIRQALESTEQLFPESASVACQGVAGAYSQMACERLFRLPNILYCSTFDAVFSAVGSGLCRYGVVPLENSTAGSVNAVYDLMTRHNFRIVRSVRVKVDHCLLVNPGTKLSDIREIYSHAQAISQSTEFLASLPGVNVIPYENTAVAAKMVAESGRKDVAALSSRACRDLYGLECLKESVQNQGNNFTRFICIAKDLEIYPGADRTSLMVVLSHEPGSLYKILSRFYALGINLNKLESRPLPDRNFEFMFYFDLETSVYSPEFQQLMGEMPRLCERFTYLGSYHEIL